MTVKLKNLDKHINKIKKKVVNMLTSGTVPNEMGDQIRDDILQKMRTGKITDGKGGVKSAPKFTKGTKRVYKAAGVSLKPKFQFKKRLIKQITSKRSGRKITIGPSTASATNKIKYLNSNVTHGGLAKERRPIMGWTRVRTNILKRIIRAAIKRNFK